MALLQVSIYGSQNDKVLLVQELVRRLLEDLANFPGSSNLPPAIINSWLDAIGSSVGPPLKQTNEDGRLRVRSPRLVALLLELPLERLIGSRYDKVLGILATHVDAEDQIPFFELVRSPLVESIPLARRQLLQFFLAHTCAEAAPKPGRSAYPAEIAAYLHANSILKGFDPAKIDEAMQSPASRLLLGQEITENFVEKAQGGKRWIAFMMSGFARGWASGLSVLSGPGFETPQRRWLALAEAILLSLRLGSLFQAAFVEFPNGAYFFSRSGFFGVTSELHLIRGKARNAGSIQVVDSALRLPAEERTRELARLEAHYLPTLTLAQAFGKSHLEVNGTFTYPVTRNPSDVPFLNLAPEAIE